MPLEDNYYEVNTRPYAKIWIDKTKELTYEKALQKLRGNQFQLLDSVDLPGKFMRGAYIYWIAVPVKNQSKSTYPLLLYNTRLSEDSTWHFADGSPPAIKKITKFGEKDPYGYFPYVLRWAWIYPVKPYATDTILIKYYNYKPKENFLPHVSDARSYASKNLTIKLRGSWFFIFGFGALFSVLIIAFSIWIYMREVAFFWYAAFCFSLLVPSIWNFESENPPLYFFSNYFEWTYTKLYVHTLFTAVCHGMFLYSFFKGQSAILGKIVRWLLYACGAAALIETMLLTTDQLHLSWILYWWFRCIIVLYGLVALYFITKIPGKQSKWIIIGALSIYFFDIVSNFSPEYTSHITLLGMLIDVFCFTVATASRFNQIQLEKYELIFQEQAREIERKAEVKQLIANASQDLRNEIASDLHDDVGTALSSISFLGEMANMQLDKHNGEVRPILERIITQSREMIQTMRGVVWVINPQSDRAFDFFSKIRSFAEVVLQSRQIELTFTISDSNTEYSLGLDLQRNLFLICKEIIVNIARHSHAKKAAINIAVNEAKITLKVTDDGTGFDTSLQAEGNGLRNLQYRSRLIHADFELISRKDEGTTIILSIPMV